MRLPSERIVARSTTGAKAGGYRNDADVFDARCVPYAVVQDVPTNWHDYERISADAVEPVPIGLILHVAGPTDEGIRVIEVWDGERAWERFRAERLAPVLAALADTTTRQPRFRDLHALHLVLGVPSPSGRAIESRRIPSAEGGR
jgi:hypothetical protein